MSDLELYDDEGGGYESDAAPPAPVSGVMGLLAARMGRSVDRSRTYNRRLTFNMFSPTKIVHHHSIFGGRGGGERRRKRWE